MLIQAFIPKSSIEAFNESVLHRLSGLDEFELYLVSVGPLIHRLRSVLASVVADDPVRETSRDLDSVENLGNALACDREVDMQTESFVSEKVLNGQHTKPPSGSETVRDKVHRPDLIGPSRDRKKHLRSGDLARLAPFVHLQAQFAVKSLNALVVVFEAHARSQHPSDHGTTPAGLLLDNFEDLALENLIISRSFRPIMKRCLSQPQDPARLPDAQIKPLTNRRNGTTLGLGAYHFPRITS